MATTFVSGCVGGSRSVICPDADRGLLNVSWSATWQLHYPIVSNRYPNLRRAQRQGGPYSKRQRHMSRPPATTLEIAGLFVIVIVVVWFATPALHRWWRSAQRTPQEIEKVERSAYYSGCNAARRAGVAPIHRGEPGYRPEMDGDNGGVACEPYY
ncbi:excalibur calcium-binding domain-containing protein [Sphingomonas sp.]|uniref:excalibur calcium-binding domain-containing protein n=1 Tax=Sphingomonas sp. TaxID=28214 RepID=UPI00260ABD8E|nr:excalibur calcium-binding domain-containing protein [Sphingomonas sp.]